MIHSSYSSLRVALALLERTKQYTDINIGGATGADGAYRVDTGAGGANRGGTGVGGANRGGTGAGGANRGGTGAKGNTVTVNREGADAKRLLDSEYKHHCPTISTSRGTISYSIEYISIMYTIHIIVYTDSVISFFSYHCYFYLTQCL